MTAESTPEREAIARLSDPNAWACFDADDLMRFDAWKQSSLRKAEAIISQHIEPLRRELETNSGVIDRINTKRLNAENDYASAFERAEAAERRLDAACVRLADYNREISAQTARAETAERERDAITLERDRLWRALEEISSPSDPRREPGSWYGWAMGARGIARDALRGFTADLSPDAGMDSASPCPVSRRETTSGNCLIRDAGPTITYHGNSAWAWSLINADPADPCEATCTDGVRTEASGDGAATYPAFLDRLSAAKPQPPNTEWDGDEGREGRRGEEG